MGEAKKRKEQGLPPKVLKKDKEDDFPNILNKVLRSQISPFF